MNALLARIRTDAEIIRAQVPCAANAIRALDRAVLHLGIAAGEPQNIHPAAMPIQQMFDRAFTVVENEIAALMIPPDGIDIEDLDILFNRQDAAMEHLNSARAAAAEFLFHFSSALS